MDDFFRAAVSLFAIIDPLGNILIFEAATRTAGRRERLAVALVSVLIAMTLLAVFALAGNDVLDFLDISQESFQIAAGVLLVLPAIRLVERGDPFDPSPGEAAVSPMQ